MPSAGEIERMVPMMVHNARSGALGSGRAAEEFAAIGITLAPEFADRARAESAISDSSLADVYRRELAADRLELRSDGSATLSMGRSGSVAVGRWTGDRLSEVTLRLNYPERESIEEQTAARVVIEGEEIVVALVPSTGEETITRWVRVQEVERR